VIYLDHNATTPLRAEVREAVLSTLGEEFGNPSSVHAAGARARIAVEEGRAQVAAFIGARPAEVVFTSGGTESNNLAIHGVVRRKAEGVILTTAIEHSSVLEPIRCLRAEGVRLRLLPVDACGRVQPQAVAAALATEAVSFVSVGWANNEIGTVQPITEIGRICRQAQVPFHVDAVQAAGKVPLSADDVDLLSLSAHKIGGPKGVGALFVRDGLALAPLLRGGGQERDRRAGTENVSGVVGMGVACRLASTDAKTYAACCAPLQERLWSALRAALPELVRNGPHGDDCLANTLNVRIPGVSGEALVAALDLQGIAVSSGSACAAGAAEPSHVLSAIGCRVEDARDGVRFSLGRRTTAAEVDQAAKITLACVQRMRAVTGAGAAHV
jgi:cysteine desulfurase